MQFNAQKFLIVMLLACNFQTIMATRKLRRHQKPVSSQKVNPIPAFIEQYKKDNPCIGTLCCSANPEYHKDIRISFKASPCVACATCQIRPVDPHNEQSYKWDGTCLDTTQSCLNIACYIPRRAIAIPILANCFGRVWYQLYFAPHYPEALAWDETHELDFKKQQIIPIAPKAQHMKRD